jgi:hypothetical protein
VAPGTTTPARDVASHAAPRPRTPPTGCRKQPGVRTGGRRCPRTPPRPSSHTDASSVHAEPCLAPCGERAGARIGRPRRPRSLPGRPRAPPRPDCAPNPRRGAVQAGKPGADPVARPTPAARCGRGSRARTRYGGRPAPVLAPRPRHRRWARTGAGCGDAKNVRREPGVPGARPADAARGAPDGRGIGQKVRCCPTKIRLGSAIPGFLAARAFQPPAMWCDAASSLRVSPGRTT